MVSTLDSESSDPGSNPGRTSLLPTLNAHTHFFPFPSSFSHTPHTRKHAHVHTHTHTHLDLEPPSLLLDALAPITSTNVVAETERHIGIRVAIRSKSVERAERLVRCSPRLFVVVCCLLFVCCCLLFAVCCMRGVGLRGLWLLCGCVLCWRSRWSYGVMVSTLDFESSDPGSNPGRTSFLVRGWGYRRRVFVRARVSLCCAACAYARRERL